MTPPMSFECGRSTNSWRAKHVKVCDQINSHPENDVLRCYYNMNCTVDEKLTLKTFSGFTKNTDGATVQKYARLNHDGTATRA